MYLRLAHRSLLLLSVFALTALLTTSCQRKTPAVLHGTWSIDHESMLEDGLHGERAKDEVEVAQMLAETLQLTLRLDEDDRFELYIATPGETDVSTGSFSTKRLGKQRATLRLEPTEGDVRYAALKLESEDELLVQFTREPTDDFDADAALPIHRIPQKDFDQRTQFVLQQKEAFEAQRQHAHASAKERLFGNWTLDNDATLAQLPKDQQENAATWVQNTKIGMIFSPDGDLEMHLAILGDKEFKEGKFTILEAEADRLALEMITDDDQATREIMIAAFLDDERLLLRPAISSQSNTDEDRDEDSDADDEDAADDADAADDTDENPDADPEAETLILQRVDRKVFYEYVNDTSGLPSLKSLGLD